MPTKTSPNFKTASLAAEEKRALEEVKEILISKYPSELLLLKLFGSKARGESEPFSDIDLLAIVKGDGWKASERMSDDIYEVMEKYD